MKAWIAFSVLLFVLSAAVAQQSTPASFQDDLLDRLVGAWNVTGVVHGNSSKQMLQADWVLHHQFLRVHQKSVENVAHRDFPFEGVFFIGYDNSEKRYVAHLMTVFGGRDSETLGYGTRTDDRIIFAFKDADSSVTQEFSYAPKSRTWHIVSLAITPEGKQIPILDLVATSLPTAHRTGGSERNRLVTTVVSEDRMRNNMGTLERWSDEELSVSSRMQRDSLGEKNDAPILYSSPAFIFRLRRITRRRSERECE